MKFEAYTYKILYWNRRFPQIFPCECWKEGEFLCEPFKLKAIIIYLLFLLTYPCLNYNWGDHFVARLKKVLTTRTLSPRSSLPLPRTRTVVPKIRKHGNTNSYINNYIVCVVKMEYIYVWILAQKYNKIYLESCNAK